MDSSPTPPNYYLAGNSLQSTPKHHLQPSSSSPSFFQGKMFNNNNNPYTLQLLNTSTTSSATMLDQQAFYNQTAMGLATSASANQNNNNISFSSTASSVPTPYRMNERARVISAIRSSINNPTVITNSSRHENIQTIGNNENNNHQAVLIQNQQNQIQQQRQEIVTLAEILLHSSNDGNNSRNFSTPTHPADKKNGISRKSSSPSKQKVEKEVLLSSKSPSPRQQQNPDEKKLKKEGKKSREAKSKSPQAKDPALRMASDDVTEDDHTLRNQHHGHHHHDHNNGKRCTACITLDEILNFIQRNENKNRSHLRHKNNNDGNVDDDANEENDDEEVISNPNEFVRHLSGIVAKNKILRMERKKREKEQEVADKEKSSKLPEFHRSHSRESETNNNNHNLLKSEKIVTESTKIQTPAETREKTKDVFSLTSISTSSIPKRRELHDNNNHHVALHSPLTVAETNTHYDRTSASNATTATTTSAKTGDYSLASSISKTPENINHIILSNNSNKQQLFPITLEQIHQKNAIDRNAAKNSSVGNSNKNNHSNGRRSPSVDSILGRSSIHQDNKNNDKNQQKQQNNISRSRSPSVQLQNQENVLPSTNKTGENKIAHDRYDSTSARKSFENNNKRQSTSGYLKTLSSATSATTASTRTGSCSNRENSSNNENLKIYVALDDDQVGDEKNNIDTSMNDAVLSSPTTIENQRLLLANASRSLIFQTEMAIRSAFQSEENIFRLQNLQQHHDQRNGILKFEFLRAEEASKKINNSNNNRNIAFFQKKKEEEEDEHEDNFSPGYRLYQNDRLQTIQDRKKVEHLFRKSVDPLKSPSRGGTFYDDRFMHVEDLDDDYYIDGRNTKQQFQTEKNVSEMSTPVVGYFTSSKSPTRQQHPPQNASTKNNYPAKNTNNLNHHHHYLQHFSSASPPLHSPPFASTRKFPQEEEKLHKEMLFVGNYQNKNLFGQPASKANSVSSSTSSTARNRVGGPGGKFANLEEEESTASMAEKNKFLVGGGYCANKNNNSSGVSTSLPNQRNQQSLQNNSSRRSASSSVASSSSNSPSRTNISQSHPSKLQNSHHRVFSSIITDHRMQELSALSQQNRNNVGPKKPYYEERKRQEEKLVADAVRNIQETVCEDYHAAQMAQSQEPEIYYDAFADNILQEQQQKNHEDNNHNDVPDFLSPSSDFANQNNNYDIQQKPKLFFEEMEDEEEEEEEENDEEERHRQPLPKEVERLHTPQNITSLPPQLQDFESKARLQYLVSKLTFFVEEEEVRERELIENERVARLLLIVQQEKNEKVSRAIRENSRFNNNNNNTYSSASPNRLPPPPPPSTPPPSNSPKKGSPQKSFVQQEQVLIQQQQQSRRPPPPPPSFSTPSSNEAVLRSTPQITIASNLSSLNSTSNVSDSSSMLPRRDISPERSIPAGEYHYRQQHLAMQPIARSYYNNNNNSEDEVLRHQRPPLVPQRRQPPPVPSSLANNSNNNNNRVSPTFTTSMDNIRNNFQQQQQQQQQQQFINSSSQNYDNYSRQSQMQSANDVNGQVVSASGRFAVKSK